MEGNIDKRKEGEEYKHKVKMGDRQEVKMRGI